MKRSAKSSGAVTLMLTQRATAAAASVPAGPTGCRRPALLISRAILAAGEESFEGTTGQPGGNGIDVGEVDS